MTTPLHIRLLYLQAIPVGALLLLLAVPGFVVLAVLSLMSNRVEKGFEEMFEG